MILERKLAIGSLDLFLISLPVDTENLVVISVFHSINTHATMGWEL